MAKKSWKIELKPLEGCHVGYSREHFRGMVGRVGRWATLAVSPGDFEIVRFYRFTGILRVVASMETMARFQSVFGEETARVVLESRSLETDGLRQGR